jgi:DDE superfamily endonuclease/Tc5 transposase DNA-binding domain/CENP-B N-terminal DNA-binding domain
MNKPERPRKKRMHLTMKSKQEMCQQKQANPTLTINQLSEKYGCNRSTVSKVLKSKNEWLSVQLTEFESKKTVNRPAKFTQLETALSTWMQRVFSQNAILTDGLLQLQAKKFATLLNVSEDDFKASNGWLDNFKKRHAIWQFRIYGESESIPIENLPEQRQQLVELLSQYRPEDVYNADETGLFFQMIPNQTLATKPVKGKKKDKERITILLCTNATGTDKLKPLVIGKSAKPRCFKNIQKENLGTKYEANKKAWMTGEIFGHWIKSLNATNRLDHRKTLVLVDNAPSHIVGEELEHVKVHFLPPNTTPYLQPCDAGIINSFKAHYRKLYLQNILEAIDAGNETPRLNIKEAIDFSVEAWRNVTLQTIINCWRKTEIVPLIEWSWPNSDIQHIEENPIPEADIQQLISSIPANIMQVMMAHDYVHLDDTIETEEITVDEEAIIEEILRVSDPDSNEDSEVEIEKIPHSVALEQCKSLLLYVEQQDPEKFVEEQDLVRLRSLLRRIQMNVSQTKQQRKVTDFFIDGQP